MTKKLAISNETRPEKFRFNQSFLLINDKLNILAADKGALDLLGKDIVGKTCFKACSCAKSTVKLCKKRLSKMRVFGFKPSCKIKFAPYIIPFIKKKPSFKKYLLILENTEEWEKDLELSRLNALEKFSGGIVHDINTILSSINAATFLLKQRTFSSLEERKENVTVIETAAAQLVSLTERMTIMSQRQILQRSNINMRIVMN